MTEMTCRCGAPATAARLTTRAGKRALCLSCMAIDRHEIPAVPEKSVPVPPFLLGSKALAIHSHPTLWLHQGTALDILNDGQNVVIATPTASGKTLVFMLYIFHAAEADPRARALVFYPAKALANDQLLRWKEAAALAGVDPEAIQQITGDTPMRHREQLLDRATVALVTPDVVHAWLIRTARGPAQRRFLADLRVAVTDEAHVYEDVLGSNAAFMFRRLDSATLQAGNRYFIQYIAATATIRSPDRHMENLTGRPFRKVDLQDNGAPRYPTTLLHVPYPEDDKNPELTAANLLTSIIDADHESQVILFHDSRQGAERIASMARRPNQLVPYRAGYLPQERRDIEDRIRSGALRGVVTTSALEVGIDMPDLNYGINNGLPPTRKQLLQRMGRTGRARPATFVILGDPGLFRRHGETLKDYYSGVIEESRLHLDNPYIAYQHALCLQQETRNPAETPASQEPDSPSWPTVFHDTMQLAQAPEPPKTLAAARARSVNTPPQLAYSLRSSGEEQLDIIPSLNGQDQQNIGTINAPAAIREAYPGAVYRHNGRAYRVKEWRRRQGKAYIRILHDEEPGTTSTRPIIRRTLLVNPLSAAAAKGTTTTHTGAYATVALDLWTSVEGFITRATGSAKMTDYLEARDAGDPAMSRKAVLMPTTGFFLYVDAPWLSPDTNEGVYNLSDLAHLLAQDHAYQRSIALQNIGVATANILMAHAPNEAHLLENAMVLYDNVHGGLGLTDPLTLNLPATCARLASSPSPNPGALHQLNTWLAAATGPFQHPPSPTEKAWRRTIQPGTEVTWSLPDGQTGAGRKAADHWQEGHQVSITSSDREDLLLPVSAVHEARPTGDWCLWQASTGKYRQLDSG